MFAVPLPIVAVAAVVAIVIDLESDYIEEINWFAMSMMQSSRQKHVKTYI